jgi:hypothetical protein
MKKSMNRDFPLSPTPKGSEVSSSGPIKPPAKKYTPQDSVNYQGMVNRQSEDYFSIFKNFPKETPRSKSVEARMDRRSDSMSNSPYFKAKAKVEVKNGVTTSTLKR